MYAATAYKKPTRLLHRVYTGLTTPLSQPGDLGSFGAPWNAVPGDYTRYGDVLPLLEERDGASVVMAPGDEMSVFFDARALPSLQNGWARSFFLHVTGWAKDQDPNTLFSKTVAPLPGDEPAWAGSYQTRDAPALVTPLAPVPRQYSSAR